MTALALLLTVAWTRVASAQSVCGPGQTVVDSVGHCCSPGQVWDASAGVCASAPTSTPTGTMTPPPAVQIGVPDNAPPTVPTQPATTSTTVQLGMPGSVLLAGMPFATFPATGPVAVSFVPERATDTITLQIQPVTGGTTVCNAPCVVNLPPGYVTITASGSQSFQSGLEVPQMPITVVVRHNEAPVGTYVAGGIVTALGVGGTVGSIALLADQNHCVPGTSGASEEAFQSCQQGNATHVIFGAVALVPSVVALIVGPSLLGAAASRPRPLEVMRPGELLHRPLVGRGPDVRLTGLALAPIPGGAMVGAGVSF